MEEEKKEISYQDKRYLDKRRILRQLSVKDEIRNYLDIMVDKIFEKLRGNNGIRYYGTSAYSDSGTYGSGTCGWSTGVYSNATGKISTTFKFISDIELYNYIKILLIDGFESFEVIYDERQTQIVDLNPIDPCNLLPQDEKWIQFPENQDLKRILSKDQIIYISYLNGMDSPMSYVEELKESYEQMKRIENELVVSRLNPGEIFKNMNKEVTFKELKRVDKKLRFMSKIPKSILKNEMMNSNDIRYNKFIERIVEIFTTQFFEELSKRKNNLNQNA